MYTQESFFMKSILHIHNQQEENKLIGTRQAFEALQKAINQIISSGASEKQVSVNLTYQNGNTYELVLKMQPSLEDDELPYEKAWDGESV